MKIVFVCIALVLLAGNAVFASNPRIIRSKASITYQQCEKKGAHVSTLFYGLRPCLFNEKKLGYVITERPLFERYVCCLK